MLIDDRVIERLVGRALVHGHEGDEPRIDLSTPRDVARASARLFKVPADYPRAGQESP
jgi:hypothetical protein